MNDVVDPVRVFVAASPDEWLPATVLSFSIHETTQQPAQVSLLHEFNRPIPMPLKPANQPRTPFSFQRFLIPELCGHRGKGIYLDADMQVFTDIRELWNFPFDGADLLAVQPDDATRRGQFSVMLLDCERLGWDIDEIVRRLDGGELDYASLMYDMKVARRISLGIPARWNALEKYVPGETALVHYTDMTHQPWVTTTNPLADLWVQCLLRAIAKGFITREQVGAEIAAGRVRPSLMAQVDATAFVPTAQLTAQARQADGGFRPPYMQLHHRRGASGLLRRVWNRLVA